MDETVRSSYVKIIESIRLDVIKLNLPETILETEQLKRVPQSLISQEITSNLADWDSVVWTIILF